ncbi:hypothetical protein HEK616_54580 [Streptomyces nigrescens]|uniref:Uncharacterized protein n=1 Tax=Streptomyces nigrescens TaxID=1920 RepID=A0ABN6R1X5_STRNI|nr:hypothetical protein HEK616_54580 [Streptomyces nigrescens]
MPHLDLVDGAAVDPALQSTADDLDLGQLGHGGLLGTTTGGKEGKNAGKDVAEALRRKVAAEGLRRAGKDF